MSTEDHGHRNEPRPGPGAAPIGESLTEHLASQRDTGPGLLDDLPEQGRGLAPEELVNAEGTVIPFRGTATATRHERPAPADPLSASAAGPQAALAQPEDAGPDTLASQQGGDYGEALSEPPDAPGEQVSRHVYPEAAREAVYRVIRQRRDIRSGFSAAPIPEEVLTRVLSAAHQAPSVGFSQPWDFVIVDDEDTRVRIRGLAERQRDAFARELPGARARAFSGLKVEAILDTPLNVAVTVDATRGGRHTLGRHAQPQTAGYSAALAVENFWLAARAEGLGVGWVSFFSERELAEELALPAHLEVVAYLCVGYVEDFPPEPELALGGWAQRRPLAWAVHQGRYGRRGLPGRRPTSLRGETVAVIEPPRPGPLEEARTRLDQMTKPSGSLGELEDVAVQLSGLADECPPPIPEPAAVAIFAADHGVHAQGVTPWPQAVTGQMVHNFLDGGAVANAFAAQVGAEVAIVDVGVAADLPSVPGLLPRKVAYGTADLSKGPAMTPDQVEQALEAGIEAARDLAAAGNRCLLTGDMGIANTTASAALICAFTGADPAAATGRGTGIDDATHARKVEVVQRALAVNQLDDGDPLDVLAALGGLEHAALAGFILGGAALRVPVILDGVIAASACLVAQAIEPQVVHACFAGHRSSEPGHEPALRHLGLRPLLDLDLRLGEGTGALLALPVLQSAARAMREVATFTSTGIDGDVGMK